ncbi:MAG: bifunctional DNA-formamidopyrimidine glycosylase/DNA-(apurinic or apyrimidinic site) lyase [Propionibacteriaceae bacterium]|jgi:formamidopyrimidine-DNA glycosylase|nr:bifunctional DNA-formamidopyrimidine glycosylase/DNA-(apurinic or apyrimidinic site) lyase [Propionibacteriaceae bacterium]
MPELPEVETVRRGLERLAVGRRIDELVIREAKSFPVDHGTWQEAAQVVEGATVTAARRRAKVLILDLDNGWSLVAHLKMTGQMVVRGAENWAAGHPTDSFLADLPDRSTRLEFGFADGSRLFFNDQRKFGWVKAVPTAEVEALPFIAALGPEPFDPAGFPEFRRRIARRVRTTIKAALLDQTVVAGIGNIYADESLWSACLHPAKPVGAVSARKLREVFTAAAAVMALSIDLGGSTDRNYVDAEGNRGSYLGFANVFRREGQPCRRCGTPIIKTRVAGRGTHLCPRCQRL